MEGTMSQIKRAYIVYIDFDGDIKSKYSHGQWLVFTELEEVKAVIEEVLSDLMRHEKEKGRAATIDVGEHYDIPIDDVMKNNQMFEDYIDYGGIEMGNWEISIYKTFEND